MKKILFMVNDLYGGGAEKILQTLLCHLDTNIYDLTLCSVNQETIDFSKYPKGISYQYIFPQFSHENASFSRRLKVKVINKIKLLCYQYLSPKLFYRIFIGGSYDTEIAFIEGYSTKIISGSNSLNKIAWVHIDLEANHWTTIAYNSLEEEINAYKRFDHICCVSENVKEAFERKFGSFKNKLLVKYNPVDEKEIKEKAGNIPLNSSPKKISLISVGRLENQKGYDRLLVAVKKLVNEGLDIHLSLLGEGSQYETLRTYIDQHNLTNHVQLLGFQQNPYKHIMKADIFVSSSRSEGFSTVVTEALILGKAIVATNCSGMEELLGASNYGLLVQNSTEALIDGLREMITNPSLLTKYQKKSKEKAQQFSIKENIKQIELLWS